MLGRRLFLLVGLLALFACVVTTEKQAEAAFSGCTGTNIMNIYPT